MPRPEGQMRHGLRVSLAGYLCVASIFSAPSKGWSIWAENGPRKRTAGANGTSLVLVLYCFCNDLFGESANRPKAVNSCVRVATAQV